MLICFGARSACKKKHSCFAYFLLQHFVQIRAKRLVFVGRMGPRNDIYVIGMLRYFWKTSQNLLFQPLFFRLPSAVLKVKIKTIRDGKDGKKYIGDSNPEKLDIIKKGSLKGKDLKRLTFYVREGANCRCNMLEESGNYLLIMGHRDNRRSKSKKLIHFKSI